MKQHLLLAGYSKECNSKYFLYLKRNYININNQLMQKIAICHGNYFILVHQLVHSETFNI